MGHTNFVFAAVVLVSQALQATPSMSFGGSQIPQAVQDLMETAKKNGAIFYDVNETDKDGEPKYNPHFSSTEATDSMTFENTEITPDILQADIDSKEKGTIISGYKSYEYEEKDEATGQMQKKTGEEAVYKEFVGGTGNVSTFYDEAYHSDHFARGNDGQKWASNCGILEDGTLHCLPAMRRSDSSDYILVNPDLARGKLMLYNGHIEIRAGVVQSVEISGRISKLCAKGKIKLINPIALMKAWGFKLAPNLQINFGNSAEGNPVEDPSSGLLVAPKSVKSSNGKPGNP